MKHLGTKTIETRRLVLRRFTLSDAEPMYRNWASDPEVTRYLLWPAHESEEETKGILKGWIAAYDKTEKYLRILEQMNGLELLILRILQNPSEFNRQNGEKIKDPNAPTPGYRNLIIYTRTYFFIEMLSELLNAAQEDVAESIYYLESNRLIVDNVSLSKLQTNGHPIRTLEDKLTSKGKDLIAFIIR